MTYAQERPTGYQELAELLRDEIASGRLRPGQRLPSEGRLAQEYGLATKTTRAALQLLRDEGLAELRRGYGVVVRQPVEPELVTAEPDSVVWSRMPTPEERRRHEVPEGVPLLVIAAPNGRERLYPGHRYRVRLAAPE